MDNETHSRTIVALARLAVERNLGDLGGPTNKGLRKFLHDYASGKCALCGGETRLDARATDADCAEVSHVISVGDSRRARMAGNVFNGCRACNLATGDRSLTPYLHLFADIFAIPTELPTRGQLISIGGKSDKGEGARKRRESLGFDF